MADRMHPALQTAAALVRAELDEERRAPAPLRPDPADLAEAREEVRGLGLNLDQEAVLRGLANHLGQEVGRDYHVAGDAADDMYRARLEAAPAEDRERWGAYAVKQVHGFNAYPTLLALERRGLATRRTTDHEHRYGRGYSDHWRITLAGVAWLGERDG